MNHIKKAFVYILCTLCILLSLIQIHHLFYIDALPVLGYHNVVSDEEKATLYADNPYTISISMFKQHMQYLYENGYDTLSMQDIEAYYFHGKKISEKSIAITIDDGHSSVNHIIKPILQQYGFQATAFVIGKKINNGESKYLQQVDLIADDTMQYFSHTYDLHRKVNGTNLKIMEVLSIEEIRSDFDKNPMDDTYFAYPYGVISESAKR